jgi:hypothetical protein
MPWQDVLAHDRLHACKGRFTTSAGCETPGCPLSDGLVPLRHLSGAPQPHGGGRGLGPPSPPGARHAPASSPHGHHRFCNSLTYASHLLLSLRVARCRWVSIAKAGAGSDPGGVPMPAFVFIHGGFLPVSSLSTGDFAADGSGPERLPPRRKLAADFLRHVRICTDMRRGAASTPCPRGGHEA